MFNESKYTNWYKQIISHAEQRSKPSISEKHHIIPLSMGGDKKQIVYLTPREHFICHRLLPKMVEGKAKRSMMWALHLMMFSNNPHQLRYKATSRTYETFRAEFYGAMKGKPQHRTKEHNENIAKSNSKRLKGKTLEELYGAEKAQEIKRKHSESRRGSKNGMFGNSHSSEAREAISKANKGNNYGKVGESHPLFGRKMSEEHKAKISAGLKLAHAKS
jgi:hypothetical protein